MNLLTKIILKNFKCFRSVESFDFSQSTYLIGINNAGKTAVLQGIRLFFDDSEISNFLLNKVEFSRKQAGYNRAEITAFFNLDALTTKRRKSDLIKKYGSELFIAKLITYAPESGSTNISWRINKGDLMSDLPDDLRWLLNSVKVTYIHPQEGKQLLLNVQRRLRQRLLANWGRGAALTHNLEDLEKKWKDTREAANRYLSQSLTDSVQSFWPESRVTIGLPRKIRELIDIADISFQGEKFLPEIELTSQGTGAQSTILYLAHYLLDSDRSLNRGEYHPIWLMEEPESFLHIDLLAKLSKQLNSEKWLQNIQMVISSHSPVLLASSKAVPDKVRWIVLNNYKVENSTKGDDVTDALVSKLGNLMGDSNFEAYFVLAHDGPLIFLEDERELTLKKFREAGVAITKTIKGVGQVGKMIDVLKATPEILRSKIYFIVDGDKGIEQLSRHVDTKNKEDVKGIFIKYSCSVKDVYIICLSKGKAVEDLFLEYEDHLLNCTKKIWGHGYKLRDKVPSNLSRVVGKARSKAISSEEEQIALIRNQQDVKDLFWKNVEKYEYSLGKKDMKKLLDLLSF